MKIELDKDELDYLKLILKQHKEEVKQHKEGFYLPAQFNAQYIIICRLIEKLESNDETVPDKAAESVIINRLQAKKQQIYDELEKKYKTKIIDEKLNIPQVVNLFNKREPELMVQLFFIDMELENLS